jgi:hypothetical protein
MLNKAVEVYEISYITEKFSVGTVHMYSRRKSLTSRVLKRFKVNLDRFLSENYGTTGVITGYTYLGLHSVNSRPTS